MSQTAHKSLLIAGPLLRRAETKRLIYWFVCREQTNPKLLLNWTGTQWRVCDKIQTTEVQLAQHAWLYLLDVDLTQTPLTLKTWIGYDLQLKAKDQQTESTWTTWRDWAPWLTYDDHESPGFVLQPTLTKVLHGSCRKPHHADTDGLLRADRQLAEHDPLDWPSVLIMSGDQVYVDDVAGPMLVAIHQLITQLGFADEALPESRVKHSADLHTKTPLYYQRDQILPTSKQSEGAATSLFAGTRKPIFTSVHAKNHLVSLAEVLAMYLLVWSPNGWQEIDFSDANTLPIPEEDIENYKTEQTHIEAFRDSLKQVQRLLAHIPSAMIFDDHDVTDDWNLTADWELAAYGHPLSRRIIGNAILGYGLCQGLGNAPEFFPEKGIQLCRDILQNPGTQLHDDTLEAFLAHNHWHYSWPTSPTLMVLDTRTQRWRSERNLNKPSGLMDWESLQALRKQLENLDSAILVSAAPMFGVKLIETIQAGFTLAGKPLVVDAENWMAHSGSANTLLDIFLQHNTPQKFIILSGDVHYSFVYDIELRHQDQQPEIWQITSSGVKNRFPDRLLNIFDRLNRWLFAPYSPLNLFTKRRNLRVIPRKPSSAQKGERLVNYSGIGLVTLTNSGSVEEVWQLSDVKDVKFDLDG